MKLYIMFNQSTLTLPIQKVQNLIHIFAKRTQMHKTTTQNLLHSLYSPIPNFSNHLNKFRMELYRLST